ncbi:GAF domain-containing protein [Pseudonocardia kongjuensis]|uniref:GAF domain-containing protein n=1 Tax=Pseudonocardia kongjuensis TaxID=102227 RepID=A0ABP4IAS7_9PSEU
MSLTIHDPAHHTPAPGAVTRLLSTLLHLLADDAPAEELSAAVRELSRLDVAPFVREALEDVVRVRSLLDLRAHREREMHGLYETARDLTSLRGTDEVLGAIVERVRRLLGCDCSYLALVDPDTGIAAVRVTSGTRTPAIATVRQRPGSGVGGRVLQTGQPAATANYRRDPRLLREPAVVSAVDEEGLVAIAGVPIKRGARVIGALFAAERRERAFEQREIALLTSLAVHATVVIENARLYERVQQDSVELRDANGRLQAQRQALERAARVHEQLIPMALTRVDLPHLVGTLAGLLEGTVLLLGPSGEVLARGAAPGRPSLPAQRNGPDGPSVRTVPVRAGQESFGRLVLSRAGAITDVDVRTLERSAQTAALLLLMERQATLVTEEMQAELVDDLLADPAPDPEDFRRRAHRLGVLDTDRPHTVLVFTATAVPRRRLLRAVAALAAPVGGAAGERDGRVVLLLPADRADGEPAGAVARTVAARLGRVTGGRVTVGAAGPGRGPEALRRLHGAATRCHRLLLALDRAGSGAGIDELGVVGSVLDDVTPAQVGRLLEGTLGPLLRYDAEHGTELVGTLDGYFGAGRNAPDAARALGVHVNTVYQRLDRVDRVLGDAGWREPRGALEMQLALRLHRLRGDPAA